MGLQICKGGGTPRPRRSGGDSRTGQQPRAVLNCTPKPILFNEDDHCDSAKEEKNFTTTVGAYSACGFFDRRMRGVGIDGGCPRMPVNWGISSPRKRYLFRLPAEMTSAGGASPQGASAEPE